MSYEYDLYLEEHKANVKKAFDWMSVHVPIVYTHFDWLKAYEKVYAHDDSKFMSDEYEPYDEYFYKKADHRTKEVTDAMNRAFLIHIHRNPHHWQYWLLTEDSKGNDEIIFEMPFEYAVEMICDWWSFSWKNGNFYEIFDWYDDHKDHIKLAPNTRKFVETVLHQIKEELDEDPETE